MAGILMEAIHHTWDSIPRFIRTLRKKENSDTITNPYRRKALADNLGFYLEQMSQIKGKCVLLVGEAPGFKGCLHTGIPFSSGTGGYPIPERLPVR